jgi:hypothetical protein
MEALVPEQRESVYAAEGTAAHALAEIKASHEFGKIDNHLYIRRRSVWQKQYSIEPEVEVEMEEHTDEYVAVLRDRMALYPNTIIMLEQRLDTGVPTCWGTSDAVLVSPQHVEIVDFKYGAGVEVEARGNPQLRLYALGALDKYGDILGETEVIRITVHQPRMGHLLTDEMLPDVLREWRESILPIAAEALGEDAHFGPSESACRWCPASGRCKAQLEDVFKTDFFQDPKLLSPEEIAEALSNIRHVQAWIAAVEEASLAMAYSEGLDIPGYKVVLSSGKRYVADPDGAIARLQQEGYTFEEVAKQAARGIGELEKLLGKTKFEELLGPYVRKSDGKPSMVLLSDKRPSVNPNHEASKDFS